MDFKPLVELMKACVEKYGMWPTVGAIVTVIMAASFFAIALRLPDILVALR